MEGHDGAESAGHMSRVVTRRWNSHSLWRFPLSGQLRLLNSEITTKAKKTARAIDVIRTVTRSTDESAGLGEVVPVSA